jgi:pentatricopeptide repeat protein
VGGAADRAWELFRQMQGAGLEPELRTYTTLMDAWINAGHADKALQVHTRGTEDCMQGFNASKRGVVDIKRYG